MSLLRKVTAKPWEHAGEMTGLHGDYVPRERAGRTGLTVFLMVISSLFALFLVSYYARSLFPDWEVLREPPILWFNTALLALASVAMQRARGSAKKDEPVAMRRATIAGAVLTLAFIAGQLTAWNELVDSGYLARNNPAIAFFYLLTGVHVLHLAGGLWYLGRIGLKMRRSSDEESLRYSVTLAAVYWHYLLLVWLVIFALLQVT